MKKEIHPEYRKVVFLDTSTNYKFLSGSTKESDETIEWEDGNTYPLLKVEISSDSHPFYTGKQKADKVGGRVDRFKKNITLTNFLMNRLPVTKNFYKEWNWKGQAKCLILPVFLLLMR